MQVSVFSKAINLYENRIQAETQQQGGSKIHTSGLELPRRYWKGLQQPRGSLYTVILLLSIGAGMASMLT